MLRKSRTSCSSIPDDTFNLSSFRLKFYYIYPQIADQNRHALSTYLPPRTEPLGIRSKSLLHFLFYQNNSPLGRIRYSLRVRNTYLDQSWAISAEENVDNVTAFKNRHLFTLILISIEIRCKNLFFFGNAKNFLSIFRGRLIFNPFVLFRLSHRSSK